MSHEPALTQALHELAEAPGPASMADVALTGAKHARRRQWALSGLAAVAVAGMVAAPFLLRPQAELGPQQAAGPGPNAVAQAGDECVHAASVSPTEKRVAQENWPDFVRIVMADLPPRADYIMQSGYPLCRPEPNGPKNAYAVINLGPLREHGHLTVDLAEVPQGSAPANCAAVRQELDTVNPANPGAPKPELLFCDEANSTTPLVFATRTYGTLYVTAVYDGFKVWMESHPVTGDQPYELGPEALRPVVTDPNLAALIG